MLDCLNSKNLINFLKVFLINCKNDQINNKNHNQEMNIFYNENSNFPTNLLKELNQLGGLDINSASPKNIDVFNINNFQKKIMIHKILNFLRGIYKKIILPCPNRSLIRIILLMEKIYLF